MAVQRDEISPSESKDDLADTEANLQSSPDQCGSTTSINRDQEKPSFIVNWDGQDDPVCPLNWPFKKKAYTTMVYAFCTFGPQYSSSVFGEASTDVMRVFGVSYEVSVIAITLFLLGVGLGPMLFAPVSEVFGRKIGVLIPFFISAFFAFGCGAALNVETVMLMRFFQGLFGGAPVSNSGGVLGDIWSPDARAIALVAYAFVVACGPTVSPIIGAALTSSGPEGWRWTSYLMGIYTIVMTFVAVFTVDETYHPVILTRKAQKLRKTTGNWQYHSEHEEQEFTFTEISKKHLIRPFRMLFTPIVAAICGYGSFCFGILYLSVTAVPIVFSEERGWGRVPAALPSSAMAIGIMIGGGMNIMASRRYSRILKSRGGKALPEERLVVMRIGCFLLPIGLFIFGWTSSSKFPWIAPCIGLALLSCGFFTIFQGCLNYLVDAFLKYSASAIAATTFTRSVLAAAFPLFGRIMFHNLTVAWGASLLGFVAIAMIPIPFIYYRYGEYLRSKNSYTAQFV
ncbi:major facilitator superfamily domain-containing protein [Dipodascopsis tothii]|uniref:major facilitator superfamily domain-containing protein n=1 Tax=Dipodascopsis tothii TaxID=44089 RepID=UPI0034CE8495